MTEENKILSEVEAARRTISSDGYPMSISELTNMYRDGELIIRPEYQRLFRWSPSQKSRLIESLLLGIPIPSIFVAQREDGNWELVDGLQRVSTILEFQGQLMNENHTPLPPLILEGTKFLPSLEGAAWGGDKEIPQPLLLDLKRSKIDIKIIKRESSREAKYDLFQRLNSYGSQLTAQEIRSAILVSISPDFFSWLDEIASYHNFIETISLPDRLIEERYNHELVLRFLILHTWPTKDLKISNLKDFPQVLDAKSMELASNFDNSRARLEEIFKLTFDFIAEHGTENIFRRWNPEKEKYTGPFLNTAFEVFALGVGYNLDTGNQPLEDLPGISKTFWKNTRSGYSTGRSTAERLVEFIPEGRKITIS